MTCTHCAKRPVLKGGSTCGNSHCQEAAYHASAARAARGRKAKEDHRRRQAECEVQAARWP
jgi:hypothetical protein